MKNIKAFIAGSLFSMPFLAQAQTAEFGFFTTLIENLTGLIGLLIPFIIGLAILVFLWGVLKFVTAAGDEEARKTGRSFMIWGVVGIFVMVSVWGLVNFLGSILNLNNAAPTELPGIPGQN